MNTGLNICVYLQFQFILMGMTPSETFIFKGLPYKI